MFLLNLYVAWNKSEKLMIFIIPAKKLKFKNILIRAEKMSTKTKIESL